MNRLRLGLALAGIALAVVAVALDQGRLGWAAIALLAGAVIVRLLQRRGSDTGPTDSSV
ncbi:MAG TPA: hypothetical protein VHR41_06090 [Gemmatimonadales bacterium]|jgi:uncharacterized membrane protein|nr:hypothetical protein [Gemmatimonadales bacterium]